MDYRSDIQNLVKSVDQGIWKDIEIDGIQYDIYPWHQYSAISIKTRSDDDSDVASWKYFECAKSEQMKESLDFKEYQGSYSAELYHRMLIKAARALLEAELSKYGVNSLVGELGLNKLFIARVYDPDETFQFNYCEYLVALDHEIA